MYKFLRCVCVQVPCYTLTHVNIHMLLSKLESLMEYAIREEIFDSLSSPEQVYILLQVMNHTLPAIAVHVSLHFITSLHIEHDDIAWTTKSSSFCHCHNILYYYGSIPCHSL